MIQEINFQNMQLKEILSNPKLYGENIDKVEFVETHVSLVVLANEFAYKFKKNVNFGFLDYSDLEKRKRYCELEYSLNKLIAPDIYIETGSLIKDESGYKINGTGEVEEYFVKMNRFDSENLWSNLAEKKLINKESILILAEKVANFHKKATESSDAYYFGSISTIKKYFDQNFEQTEEFIDGVWDRNSFEETQKLTEDFFENNKDIFLKRIENQKIIEAHGDLHFGNICNFNNEIQIFDRIEFNDEFRNVDTIYDIAYILMDLDLFNLENLTKSFLDKYIEITGDKEGLKLLPIYMSRQSYVRGKVLCFGFNYLTGSELDIQKDKAKKYLELSLKYLKSQF